MARFKAVYITEPGKDFSSLIDDAEKVVFICNGFEHGKNREENIAIAVSSFDPKADAWVPVGRMLSVAKTALDLARAYPGHKIMIGVYKDGEYTWEEM